MVESLLSLSLMIITVVMFSIHFLWLSEFSVFGLVKLDFGSSLETRSGLFPLWVLLVTELTDSYLMRGRLLFVNCASEFLYPLCSVFCLLACLWVCQKSWNSSHRWASCHVSAGNWTCVFWKSSRCSNLSHLSSPSFLFFKELFFVCMCVFAFMCVYATCGCPWRPV